MLIPSKFQKAVLASCTLACMSLPALAQSAGEAKVKQLIDEAKANDNNYQLNSGRIANSNVFYVSYCSASHFGAVYLVRDEGGKEPTVYLRDQECISGVSWRDIDGDGVPEIKLNARSGGSGVSVTTAVFLRWEKSAPSPIELASFIEYGYESWDGIYNYYKFTPDEWYPFTIYKDGFLPIGAQCPNVNECEIKKRVTFCIEKCDKEIPKSMSSHKDWPKFLAALAADGYEPGNKKVATITPVEDAEKQAAFDSWLSE